MHVGVLLSSCCDEETFGGTQQRESMRGVAGRNEVKTPRKARAFREALTSSSARSCAPCTPRVASASLCPHIPQVHPFEQGQVLPRGHDSSRASTFAQLPLHSLLLHDPVLQSVQK